MFHVSAFLDMNFRPSIVFFAFLDMNFRPAIVFFAFLDMNFRPALWLQLSVDETCGLHFIGVFFIVLYTFYSIIYLLRYSQNRE
jgi:hypothetical protein